MPTSPSCPTNDARTGVLTPRRRRRKEARRYQELEGRIVNEELEKKKRATAPGLRTPRLLSPSLSSLANVGKVKSRPACSARQPGSRGLGEVSRRLIRQPKRAGYSLALTTYYLSTCRSKTNSGKRFQVQEVAHSYDDLRRDEHDDRPLQHGAAVPVHARGPQPTRHIHEIEGQKMGRECEEGRRWCCRYFSQEIIRCLANSYCTGQARRATKKTASARHQKISIT